MMKIDAVLGVEEVRRLLRSALAWLDDYRETSSLFGEAEDADERLLGWVAAMQALRFGACQAAALGEHSVMPLLEEALETISTFNDDPICNGEMVAKAAGMLAGLEEVPSAVTQRLARHNEADVRRAIAAHLDPDVPAACALLEELADDAQSNVSNAARASLGEQRSVAWWRGKFDSDPAARLTADELPRYAGILGEIRDALAHPWWQAERKIVARLPELVAALPPVLSLELAGRLLKTEHLAAEIAAKILAAILPL